MTERSQTNHNQSRNKSEEVDMINKTIMTAGAFILSMMVLIAATNVDSLQVSEQDRDHHTLSGVVVDADTEEAVPNATVYIKKKNGDDRMQADRTQQQEQQQQQDRAAGHDQEGLEQTTTDHNGEFEFANLEQIISQQGHAGAQEQQQQQQQQHGAEDDTFVLVVEAEGYETEEKEIKLSEYLALGQDREHGAMDRDEDRDRDYDRDRDDDKDKDKIKIELTRSN